MKKIVALINLGLMLLAAYGWAMNQKSTPWFVGLPIVTLLAANAVLLWQATSGTPKSRIGRMLGYWLDSKEAELKAKANVASGGSSSAP